MATVTPPAKNVAEMLQNLSLDSKAKTEPNTKKTGAGAGAKDSMKWMDPSAYYVPNPYYYYGGDYTGYANSESGYGYGYAAYPSSQGGSDGQYQYPSYFPLTSGPFASSVPVSTNKAANVKTVSAEKNNSASAGGLKDGNRKGVNGTAPVKPLNQNARNTWSNVYGSSDLSVAYQDPWFNYNGYYAPASWYYGSNYSDVQKSGSGNALASSYSKANGNVAGAKNQNYRSNSQYTSMYQPLDYAAYYNRMYPSKYYGQYGSTVRSGTGYGTGRYDSRRDGGVYASVDNRSKRWGRSNDYYYRNESFDGMNELNRGPRATEVKNQKDLEEGKEKTGEESDGTAVTEETKTCVVPDKEEFNREDFPIEYKDALFFIIKSYSEDDVHKSIKYNVWASTPNGNKKLDAAYQEAQQKPDGCPVFLLFSVNSSGQFIGLAEMTGPVDFNTNIEYWQQDKWTGSFPLKWHIVKDVPNSVLKHITLEYNENKPVTNSRDTQEVKLEQALLVLKIFKEHNSKTCIFDDFSFYEIRQKTILERKAIQQARKQAWEGKTNGEQKKEAVTADLAKALESTTSNPKVVAEETDSSNIEKEE